MQWTTTQNKHKKTKARFSCLLRHPAGKWWCVNYLVGMRLGRGWYHRWWEGWQHAGVQAVTMTGRLHQPQRLLLPARPVTLQCAWTHRPYDHIAQWSTATYRRKLLPLYNHRTGQSALPSVSRHCWFGVRKNIWSVKKLTDKVLAWFGVSCKWFAYGPSDAITTPIICCFVKIQIGLSFLVSTYLGCSGKEAIKWVSVCHTGQPVLDNKPVKNWKDCVGATF